MKTSIIKQSNLLVLIILFVFSTIAVNAQVAINSSGTTPNAGIAMLDVDSPNKGVLIPRMAWSSKPGSPIAGLLVYVTGGVPTGEGFYYYDGTAGVWKGLGDASGILAVTAGGTGTGTQFTPGSVVFAGTGGVYTEDNANFFWDATNTRLGIGTVTPATNLHVKKTTANVAAALLLSHQGTGDVAMRYYLNNAGFHEITTGIDNDDNDNFEISNTGFLTGTTYTDANTMLRIHTESGSEGITDINHQSRARVFLGIPQMIPMGIWTPIEFDAPSYDEHVEFILGGPGIPAQFIAKEEGFYQINARTEFETDFLEMSNPYGYVSIAIAKNQSLHSIGNNLQIDGGGGMNPGEPFILRKNNAPNVSDVVYLLAGEKIEIWVWQDFVGPNANILPNTEITYVSIHKIS